MRKVKIAIICFIVFIIGIIFHVAVVQFSRIGKVAVEIKYAPFKASVFIDDQNYYTNNAINYLEPGQHRLMVVMSGFKTFIEDIEITEETKYLYGSLEALSSNEENVYQKYQQDYGQVESIAGIEATKEAQVLVEKWPILKHLPIIKDNYRIGTVFEDQNTPTIIIHAEPIHLDSAINKLRTLSDNLGIYNIIIHDFKNMLANQLVDNDATDPLNFLKIGYQNLSLPHQINSGQELGGYYYTTISVGKHAGYIPTTYRVILRWTGTVWELATVPYPLLTIYNTRDIDQSVLDAVNQLAAPTTIQTDSLSNQH